MKAEFVDVNDTRKNVRVEISSDVVDAQIERHARDYSRRARVPGLPPGHAITAPPINVRFELSSDVVDAQIERHARDYSPRARIPGFRPGKAPTRVITQR